MSALYLIRHGQAGLRSNYDRLSDLGHEQTHLLGSYLALQEIPFAHLYCGELRRQKETAANVVSALRTSVQLQSDARWNEFDLDDVYRKIAPQIAAIDAKFRDGYQEMLAAMDNPESTVHRGHSHLDAMVVHAWIANRFPYDGESFSDFTIRIQSALNSIKTSEGSTIVFTSATPTAIAIATALDLPLERSLKLAGVTYNASISTLRIQPQEISLFSFNGIPHLSEPRLRTFR